MHQLKPNDAVKCNSVEEWIEIIKLCAQNKIQLELLDNFEGYPVFYMDESNYIDSSHRVSYSHKLHLFQDFCAKIKGEYKEPEFFLYVSRDREVRVISSDDPNVPAIMLPPGKYKLTRVDE